MEILLCWATYKYAKPPIKIGTSINDINTAPVFGAFTNEDVEDGVPVLSDPDPFPLSDAATTITTSAVVFPPFPSSTWTLSFYVTAGMVELMVFIFRVV